MPIFIFLLNSDEANQLKLAIGHKCWQFALRLPYFRGKNIPTPLPRATLIIYMTNVIFTNLILIHLKDFLGRSHGVRGIYTHFQFMYSQYLKARVSYDLILSIQFVHFVFQKQMSLILSKSLYFKLMHTVQFFSFGA